MKKQINTKVKALQDGASSQEEFMKQLANLDEAGQLTDDLQQKIDGGISILSSLQTMGMFPQEPIKLQSVLLYPVSI
ncbi:hypothetical protein WBJ53_23590 [Spirosoma sp. SC4-14]|uniref:hypothetical protein n=1 Tax=Spirosoma sp. SC4-14 TaxID=3128900 RepID=UPI0030D3A988